MRPPRKDTMTERTPPSTIISASFVLIVSLINLGVAAWRASIGSGIEVLLVLSGLFGLGLSFVLFRVGRPKKL